MVAVLRTDRDVFFMRLALVEAQNAFDKGEIPVGCVVVSKDRVISKSHNGCEALTDPTAHAEMQAITAACHYLGTKQLMDCTLYVTLEPCIMCLGALFLSRMGVVVYGAGDSKYGFSRHGIHLHPKSTIRNGVLETESLELLQCFFKKYLRKK